MNTIPSRAKWFLVLGGLNAVLAMAIGAAGAHLLKAQLVMHDPLGLFPIALQYHQLHAIGLLILGLVVAQFPTVRCFFWAGWSLCAGIVLFSGVLYLRSLTGIHSLHMAVPVGGTLFIVGWGLCVVGALRLPTRRT